MTLQSSEYEDHKDLNHRNTENTEKK